MEIGEMVPQVLLPLRTGPRKRRADLEFGARQEVRDLIKALVCDVIPALPEDGISTTVDFAAAALVPPEPTAPPRDSHPYPDPAAAAAPEPVLARCPDCRESELRCQCPSGEDATDYDGEHDDGPEPYHALSGPQCGARDGTWFCSAQRGHGGPDHLSYAAGEIRHRWPRTEPGAPLLTVAALTADDERAYIDNPTPHPDDCDCENCVTFYAGRSRS